MNSKRPATISVKELSAAVDHAVKVVSEKNKVQFASGLHIGPTISGKTVRGIKEIAQAEAVASQLTHEISGGGKKGGSGSLAGAPLEPAVLLREGLIICGFIAPEIVTFEQ